MQKAGVQGSMLLVATPFFLSQWPSFCCGIALPAFSLINLLSLWNKRACLLDVRSIRPNISVCCCLYACSRFAPDVGHHSSVFPGIDHGDESEVVNHAVRFGSGDLNPHRFQYGSLVQYLLFIIYGCYYVVGSLAGSYDSVHQFAVQFVRDPSMFYILARGLSACFGAATVWITYAIGKRVKGEGTGIVAALLLALSYQHVIHSHYATVDAAVTFFFSCAVYRSVILLSDRRLGMYLYAGFIHRACSRHQVQRLHCPGCLRACTFFEEMEAATLTRKLFSRKWLLGLAAVIAGHFARLSLFLS